MSSGHGVEWSEAEAVEFGQVLFPDGVVDFIDLKFYGIFGWERWPTFNLADTSVVVGGIILLISFLLDEIRRKKNEQKS